MTSSDSVPAGWYPDPLGLPQMRWWDGVAWTEDTSGARRPLIAEATQSVALGGVKRPDPTLRVTEPPVVDAAPPIPTVATPIAERITPVTELPLPPAASPPVAATQVPSAARTATMTAPPVTAIPTAAPELGWAGAALALHSVQSARVPMVIELEPTGLPAMTIDTRAQAFDWDLELDAFPEAPAGVRVSIDLVDAMPDPTAPRPRRPLDTLLWKIGAAAFRDRLAPWLHSGERYRLSRWPNVASLQPDMDQLRQTAMLANAAFTIDQLAAASGRSIAHVRTLVNTLSLLGALATEPAPAVATAPPFGVSVQVSMTSAPAPAYPQTVQGGIFQRLREKLGM